MKKGIYTIAVLAIIAGMVTGCGNKVETTNDTKVTMEPTSVVAENVETPNVDENDTVDNEVETPDVDDVVDNEEVEPTKAETVEPTEKPTIEPTKAETVEPTKKPTEAPKATATPKPVEEKPTSTPKATEAPKATKAPTSKPVEEKKPTATPTPKHTHTWVEEVVHHPEEKDYVDGAFCYGCDFAIPIYDGYGDEMRAHIDENHAHAEYGGWCTGGLWIVVKEAWDEVIYKCSCGATK